MEGRRTNHMIRSLLLVKDKICMDVTKNPPPPSLAVAMTGFRWGGCSLGRLVSWDCGFLERTRKRGGVLIGWFRSGAAYAREEIMCICVSLTWGGVGVLARGEDSVADRFRAVFSWGFLFWGRGVGQRVHGRFLDAYVCSFV